MKPLTAEELKVSFKERKHITFHPDFQIEEWKDGERKEKLIITHMASMSNNYHFVGYRCSSSSCRTCNSQDISYSLFGHHQIIDDAGYNQFKKIEFVETKKRTLENEKDNPVFVLFNEDKEK